MKKKTLCTVLLGIVIALLLTIILLAMIASNALFLDRVGVKQLKWAENGSSAYMVESIRAYEGDKLCVNTKLLTHDINIDTAFRDVDAFAVVRLGVSNQVEVLKTQNNLSASDLPYKCMLLVKASPGNLGAMDFWTITPYDTGRVFTIEGQKHPAAKGVLAYNNGATFFVGILTVLYTIVALVVYFLNEHPREVQSEEMQ
jgi:hypothetical protein